IVDANGTPIALTSVVSGGALPEEFALEQNCPNPFNPETVISYSLEKVGDVSLEVYNCLGQRVRVLFAGNQPTGKHTVRFDGTDDTGAQLASGVYLYRLRVGDQQLTRKMVLLK
ncbi:MAG: T9SS type A sorting domain-containing protein, partial [candidate division Zixibacteria bacterium]|nr:T9SS type A sorting domain-containing protein [candidate division Zixibacteria bacterium]